MESVQRVVTQTNVFRRLNRIISHLQPTRAAYDEGVANLGHGLRGKQPMNWDTAPVFCQAEHASLFPLCAAECHSLCQFSMKKQQIKKK